MPNQDSQCPYCKHDFGKSLKAKRVCPACKSTIVIRAGHPVTEAKAKAIDDKREAARDAEYMREVEKIKKQAVSAIQRNLRQYKQTGVSTVVVRSSPDCCEECKAMDGKSFSLVAALQVPPVPVKTCTSDFCRCSLEAGGFQDARKQAYWQALNTSTPSPQPEERQSPSPTARRSSGCLVFLVTGLALAGLALSTYLHW